jgi:hypothetical protein
MTKSKSIASAKVKETRQRKRVAGLMEDVPPQHALDVLMADCKHMQLNNGLSTIFSAIL